MKIQFVKEDALSDYPTLAEFQINEKLTEEEVEKIYAYIFEEKEKWETAYENGDDCDDEFDYWLACYNACKEIIPHKLIENPVQKTFYI